MDKYGPTELAVGKEEADYGNYLNWLHRSDATLTFPQTLVLRYTRLEPEEKRNPQVASDYRRWFLHRMRSVERALEDRQYLCADRFTIADICIVYCVVLANSLDIDEVFTPNVKRYWDLVTARPAYKKVFEYLEDYAERHLHPDWSEEDVYSEALKPTYNDVATRCASEN